MTHLVRASCWGLAVMAVVSLAACGQQRRPGPAEIALLTRQLDAELNAPVQSLHEEVIRSIADKWIFPEELVVTFGDAQSIGKARYRWALEMNRRVH
jgi:hypothetical protein